MIEKKQPMRKCIGCSEMRPKRDLIRVVRTPEGDIRLDFTGKLNGRGAYLCPQRSCLEKARKARRLERAFSVKVEPEIYDELNAELEQREGGIPYGSSTVQIQDS